MRHAVLRSTRRQRAYVPRWCGRLRWDGDDARRTCCDGCDAIGARRDRQSGSAVAAGGGLVRHARSGGCLLQAVATAWPGRGRCDVICSRWNNGLPRQPASGAMVRGATNVDARGCRVGVPHCRTRPRTCAGGSREMPAEAARTHCVAIRARWSRGARRRPVDLASVAVAARGQILRRAPAQAVAVLLTPQARTASPRPPE